MTELTKEELVRAGSAHLQSAGRWLPTCCMFPKEHLLSEGCSTNTHILVIHLVGLPFHHRIELGFQVNKLGCEWLSSCNTLLREFSSFLQFSFPFSLPITFSSTPTSSCLLYLITRPETAPVSLLPQRDTSFIQLLKQIKQSFPFPWATCSKYKRETNYNGGDKSPLNSWSRAQIWRLIFCLNHRVMPGSSREQIVPLASTELTLKCANWVSFPMDYEAIWWRLLIWYTNQHLDITHGKSLKVCLCNARLLGSF